MLSADIADLIGVGCEAVLYGMYCIIFVISVIVMLYSSYSPRSNKFIFFMNCLLFACATTHFAITFNGFYLTLGNIGVDGFANATTAGLGANALISVTDCVGQCILIYRCWAVWGRKYYVVAIPFVASLAALACFCTAVGLASQIDPTSPVPPPAVQPLVLTAYILPLITNFMLTCLIAGRIWYMSRGARVYSVAPLSGRKPVAFKAAAIIVESGALYFVVQLIYLTVFAVGNNFEQTISLIAVQVYGIAPTLIIIQVGLGLSSEETTGQRGSAFSGRMTFTCRPNGVNTSTISSSVPAIRFAPVDTAAWSNVEVQRMKREMVLAGV